MKVCTLASGSTANSTYIESGDTRILIDAGLSGRGTLRRLEEISVLPLSLSGIFITHEHKDHTKALKPLLKKYKIPVYANAPTAHALREFLPPQAKIRTFSTGKPVELNGLSVLAFKVPHDGAEPVGYVVSARSKSVGVLADCGFSSTLVKQRLKDVNMLVVESNYDKRQLMEGPYPWQIKQRIKGRHGHLSNEDAAALIAGVFADRPAKVVLAHLSENCNEPEIAREATIKALSGNGMAAHEIHVAPRDKLSPFWIV